MSSAARWPGFSVPGGLDWQEHAACVRQPEATKAAYFAVPEQVTSAIGAVCGGCPVRQACLDFAVGSGSEGIWAATTSDDRRRIVRHRRTG